MNYKKILFGILLMIIGIASVVVAMKIKSRIHEGKIQISNAQEKVNIGKSLFSKATFADEIGKGITQGAQNQINQGKQTIYNYYLLSNFLLYGGISFIILGTLVIFIPTAKRKN